MKTLIAGPWYGTLASELLCWQGWLRAQSKFYNRTVVVAPAEKRAIYMDFADEIVAEVPAIPGATRLTAKDVPVVFIDQQPIVENQIITPLGEELPVTYHMAVEAVDKYPLSRREWASIVCKLDTSLDVAWVTDDQRCFQIGGTDLRGHSFDKLLDAVCRSNIVVAPSGAITAIAACAGVPFVTWIDKGRVNLFGSHWNPHRTPCLVLCGKPSVTQLQRGIHNITQIVAELESEPQPWAESN